MFEAGQLGRKTGGGFYRVTKTEDGGKLKETFDLDAGDWRQTREPDLLPAHRELATLMNAQDACGTFARDLMGGTLLYAADLVPQIADDIVNIDRAMRWGFAWQKGPFEMLDELGPAALATDMKGRGQDLPAMLAVLDQAGATSFYRDGGAEYLGSDGAWHKVPV